jgi:DNA sulfur modification protein DndD
VDRSIAAAPKEDAIKTLSNDLKTALTRLAELENEFRAATTELRPILTELESREAELSRLRRKCVDEQAEYDTNARIGQLARRTQEVMKEFVLRARHAKMADLSEKITTSFRYLLSKKKLISQVLLDPNDFSIRLFDADGALLPKSRLSEGEKQIFALSVLWGLSQASARPLPAIIDTPMGRLDSSHRDELVHKYFPFASHQVIILSTDTEIEQQYFNQIQPSIARTFHLRYDESEKATHVDSGYFWKSNPKG